MSKTQLGDGSIDETETFPDLDSIPVEGADTLFEVVQDPNKMKEWAENLQPAYLEKTQQESGHDGAHTLGENIVRNYQWQNWRSVMESLEKVPDPARGEPPHGILRHPGAVLDNLIHLTDLDKIRLEDEHFKGLPRTRRRIFEYLVDEDRPVDGSDLTQIGGVDAALYGAPGSGKSSLGITISGRIMEINNEPVVWRGSPARTEWLPLAPWTTLCLPEGVDAKATLAPPEDDAKGVDVDFEPVELDLEKVVREVVRYEDLTHLNQEVLERGAFHVVYPDPKFRECESITRRASETKPLDYTTAWEARSDDELSAEDITPTKFWWYSWLISHVSEGMAMPVSWVCDESKVMFPNSAEKADHDQPRYIRAVSDKYIDMRRSGLSMYLIGHVLNKHFSHHLRDLMRWGVTMNGKRNPVDTDVLAGSAPMKYEVSSGLDVGEALFWNAVRGEYTEFGWSDIPRRFKLLGKLRITYPGVQGVREQC